MNKLLQSNNSAGLLLAIGMLVGFLFSKILPGFVWVFIVALIVYIVWCWYSAQKK